MKNKNINSIVVVNIMIFILILSVLIGVFGSGKNFTGNIEMTFRLVYIEAGIFLVGIIMLPFSKIKITSVGVLYYIFYFIFLFGQVNCKYIFDFKDEELFDMTNYVTMLQIQKGILLSTYGMVGIYLGILISNIVPLEKNNISRINETYEEKKSLKFISKFLVICALPFACAYLVKNISYALTGGYVESYSNATYGASSIIDKIKPFFIIGLLGILYSCKDNKKRFIQVYIGIILYSGLEMMIGARGLPILQVAIASMMYNYIYGVTKKQIVVAVLAIIPISVVISVLRITRDSSMTSWLGNIPDFISQVMKKNPILTAINEMGTAIYPTALSIDIFPKKLPYKYGKTFLYALSEIIPNLSGGVHKAKLLANVNIEVGKYTGIAFGGSVVQEIYANFGFWSVPIILAIMTILFSYIEKKVLNKSTNPITKVLWFSFLIQFLWTVRNNLAPLVRYSTWYLLTTFIMYRVTLAQKRGRKNGKSKYNNTSI